MFGESVLLVFTEDVFAIDDNVKNASLTFDQFRFGSGFFFNRVRQTGGCGQVVSLGAVGNRDLHPTGLLFYFCCDCFLAALFSLRV